MPLAFQLQHLPRQPQLLQPLDHGQPNISNTAHSTSLVAA
jgi:hypothetical protein